MKILYFFKQYNTPMYLWQNVHIIDELARHGIEIEIFNPLQFDSADEANEKLLAHIKAGRYDLFMTPHNEADLYIETIKQIKATGIPMLLFCCDSLMKPLMHKKMAYLFDLAMISQKDEKNIFKSFGANTIVSHYAANPFFFRPDYTCEKIHRVDFPGSPYGSRVHVINHLLSGNVPISLFANITPSGDETAASRSGTTAPDDGAVLPSDETAASCSGATASDDGTAASRSGATAPGSSAVPLNGGTASSKSKANILHTFADLMRHDIGRRVVAGMVMKKIKGAKSLDASSPCLEIQPAVDLETTNQIFASYDLSLSIAIARNTGYLKNPVNIVHLRNFEIPMSGGVQFCQHFDELAECFEEDKEIVFYRTNEEMLEKAGYYLRPENEPARTAIRIAARKRAENEHTWFNRFKNAFDKMGVNC